MTKKAYSLAEIASFTQSECVGNKDHLIEGVASLEKATKEQASFLENPRYEPLAQKSSAGVIFIEPKQNRIEGKNYLLHPNPSAAFQLLVDLFFKESTILSGFSGIHPTAVIHEKAKLGENITVGPHAVIDADVTIGNNTFVGAGAYIGPESTLGNDCVIHPKVVIRERAKIGNRVILQPGAVIGACGFGYTTDKFGVHHKLNQLGIVEIEDDVEIGANTTIDRSRFEVTTIKKGSKIDNLVQIGHNVSIGAHNIIVAQTGVAGSTETDHHVVIGGQSAVAGHLKVAAGVMLAGRSGVTKSITKPGKYGGVPARPLEEFNRNSVYLNNIEKHIQKLKSLSCDVEKLKENFKC